MIELEADILVAGGGVGGVAAALAAARRGRRIILTEESDWLGGQLTSQAVPPDEHQWIETTGGTQSYRRFRTAVRDYYRHRRPLTPRARAERYLNPGAGFVSGLCHEPSVAAAVIDGLLSGYRRAGSVRVLPHHRPVAATVEADRATSVTFEVTEGSERVVVVAPFVVDATETGELLPLTGTEYVTGREAYSETGEAHAAPAAQPLNMQAITVCFAMDHCDGEDHTIDRPAQYDFWRAHRPAFWPGPQLGWDAPDPRTLETVRRRFDPNPEPDPFFDGGPPNHGHGDRELWLFRRIAARKNFRSGFLRSDITLVNWPMIDYLGGPIFEVAPAEAARHLEAARQLSLSMMFWMQTEAPRPDGGTGYPGLRLRPDVVGTPDGLAKRPYVRESRRIRALHTITEQEVSGAAGAATYEDSVGTGSYRIDLHPSTGGDNYIDVGGDPYEIPLGALIPIRMWNLLPGAKNIGTTHVTNGCYRLHPTEWNIGEVAGLLASVCHERGMIPAQVRGSPALLEEFRTLLAAEGVTLRWPPSI